MKYSIKMWLIHVYNTDLKSVTERLEILTVSSFCTNNYNAQTFLLVNVIKYMHASRTNISRALMICFQHYFNHSNICF